MKGSVLVIGLYGQSALHAVKRLPLPGESILSTEIQFEPGGKGYNQALSACRMGCRTVFATAVGADLWGTQAEQCFKDSGFSQYRAISVPGASTAFASVLAAEDGENEVVVNQGACGRVTEEMIFSLEDLFSQAVVVLLQCELPPEALRAAVSLAKRHHAYTILNPAPARDLPASIFEGADLLTPNWTEAHQLCGLPVEETRSPSELAKRLLDKGSKSVIITMGHQGAFLSQGGREHFQPAFPIQAVDSTGAGDTFNGAVACEIARGIPLEQSLQTAAAASALCVSRSGVLQAIPWRREVESFLQGKL